MQPSLIIGSRSSPLALAQSKTVQALLCRETGKDVTAFPIKTFTTTGDRLTGRLAESGGKGLFVKELDESLAIGAIDIAVHSMKDVPTTLNRIFEITAILPREDPRDAFISHDVPDFMSLPMGATVGTASLRRQAQTARLRPDLKYALLRGNVGTRLAKLQTGECAATFLAMAGLNRLGQSHIATHAISTDDMLPAPAQGAVGIQIRADDGKARALCAPLHDSSSDMTITAERAFLKALDGSCRTPVAALAELSGDTLRMRGEALSPDGKLRFARDVTITLSEAALGDAYALGYSLGMEIRFEAGQHIFWDIHAK
ncbi:hydroxymethylbilane synthase [Robiginitomaculum antarcticum]|uniref:hydroxymethylbilane synthase n=1 Tax=Robiginitomaculum antarcticum TaxID=437507 RepID=UPI00035D86AB|nr:hydroxymethylbilane synthase [Robiginitomaculum antarcticum]